MDRDDLIYITITGFLIISALSYFSYEILTRVDPKSIELKSLFELANYANEHLFSIFEIVNIEDFSVSIMSNVYFFNFLKHYIEFVPTDDFMYFSMDFNDKLLLKDFLDRVQDSKNIKTFEKIKVSKRVLFQLIINIKHNLFLNDL